MYAITLSTIATLTHNTTPITIRTILTMQHPTMTTKIIAVQTQILEDAADADIENNIINTPKAYSTKCTIGFCRILQEYYLIHQNTVRINMATYFYQEFILLKYSMAFGENSTNVFP